jgi:hypothetical protein
MDTPTGEPFATSDANRFQQTRRPVQKKSIMPCSTYCNKSIPPVLCASGALSALCCGHQSGFASTTTCPALPCRPSWLQPAGLPSRCRWDRPPREIESAQSRRKCAPRPLSYEAHEACAPPSCCRLSSCCWQAAQTCGPGSQPRMLWELLLRWQGLCLSGAALQRRQCLRKPGCLGLSACWGCCHAAAGGGAAADPSREPLEPSWTRQT